MALLFLFSQRANAQNSVSNYGCVDVPEFDVGCEADYFVAESVNGNEIDTYAEAETDYEDVTVTVRGDIYINGVLANSQFGANGEESEAYPEVSLTSVPGTYTGVVDATACAIAILDPGSDCGDDGTSVTISATLPNISSINPPTIMIGSSGTITVSGTNFLDQFGNQPLPVSNAGVSLTVSSISNGQAVFNYSVPATAIAGQSSLFFEGLFGDGAGQTLTIIDPSPTITGVNPPAWPSGTTTSVTITGRGFGTSPSVTIAGPGVTGTSITYVSDTQIVANVTVAALVAAQTATIQLQSNGYTGSGFLGSPGQPQKSAVSVPLSPVHAVPEVLFFGNPITGPLTVFAGQKMSLSVQQPASSLTVVNGIFSSISFSQPNIPVAINGWTPGIAPTYTTNVSATPASTSTNPFTFYWISGGTFTVDYQWTVQDLVLGQTSGSTAVTFNVAAPTVPGVVVNPIPANPGVSAAPGVTNVIPVIATSVALGTITGIGGIPTLQLTGVSYNQKVFGVVFQPLLNRPGGDDGQVSWVQLIQRYVVRYRGPTANVGPTGTKTCTQTTSKALDNKYPYQGVDEYGVALDSPGVQATTTTGTFKYSEVSIDFSATMYLLWSPTSSDFCDHTLATDCTVPLPQGYVTWNAKGDAVNTLLDDSTNYTTWIADSALCVNAGPYNPFTADTTYPTWTAVFTNGPNQNCSTP